MSSAANKSSNPIEFGNTSNVCFRSAATLLPIALLMLAGCKHAQTPDVVATVNGHAIMRADMNRIYQTQLGQAQSQQGQNQQPSPEESESLRLNSVKELISEEILVQRAAKMNLTATSEEVDAKVNEMKAPFPNQEQFEAQLKATGRTLEDLKRDVRRSLTIDKLLAKEIKSKISVTDADVSNYYNRHKADFNLIEPRYHIAVIRVTSVPSPQPGNLQNSKATTDAEAKKKIQALKNRLDSGEDFAAMAQNFSEDPSTAASGGDMGFPFESQLKSDPTVGQAILRLKPGQVTDIYPMLDAQTKKPVGYAIYKLIDREPQGQREITDPVVQQSIRELLRSSRSQLVQNAYFEMLRDQAKVENFYAEQIVNNGAK